MTLWTRIRDRLSWGTLPQASAQSGGGDALPDSRSWSISTENSELITFLRGNLKSLSGIDVTADTALRFSAWWAARKRLSEDIGQLPLKLYERTEAGRQRLSGNVLDDLFFLGPNEEMTTTEFLQFAMGQVLDHGNFMAVKEISNRGQVMGLWTRQWENFLGVKRNSQGRLQFHFTENGREKIYQRSEVLMFHGPTKDGVLGLSPIRAATESIGLGLAGQKHGALFFKNGASPGLKIKLEGALGPEEKIALKKDIVTGTSGDRAQQPIVTGPHWDIEPMELSSMRDAQFVEILQLSVQDIGRIFNIPPHLLGDLSRATFNNIEAMQQFYLTHTIQPWLTVIEQALGRDLLSRDERRRYYWEFITQALVKTDIVKRFDAYTKAITAGILSINQVLQKENENPIGPEGDIRVIQSSYTNLETLMMEFIKERDAMKGQLFGSAANQDEAPDKGEGEEEREGEREEEEDPPERAEVPPRSGTPGRAGKRAENRDSQTRLKLRKAHHETLKDAALRVAKRFRRDIGQEAQRQLGVERSERSESGGETRGSEQFVEWLSEYLEGQSEYVKRAFGGVFKALGISIAEEASDQVNGVIPDDVGTLIDAFIDAFAGNLTSGKRAQLRTIIEDNTDPDTLLNEIETRLEEWEEKDPDKTADKESVKLDGFLTRAVWTALGYKVVWRTSSACEFCEQLEGAIVESNTPFVVEGGNLNDTQGNVMNSRQHMSHPPAHRGCQCYLEPVMD